MATKPINELDFAAIKEQFIAHLKNQTQFKDYNFEGSNMNVLLDVLSYNTFMNNYYTNMAINEMFLDSAVIKNSVVSHAKELNYLPRSRKSAKAIVSVSIIDNTATGQTITIPRFTEFNTNYQGTNYRFLTNQVHVARRTTGNTFVATGVEIFEGQILSGFEKDAFFLDDNNFLRANLTNENIDIDTIEVFVDEEATEGQNQFFYTPGIFGVLPNSKVFYLEPYFDNRYAIYFGRNVYGEQPDQDTDIRVQYRICSGAEPNGASKFGTSFRSNATVTTVQAATGGAERETIDDIKYFAPKSLQIQERAVTADDYSILLRQRFPEIQSVSVYGGDELDPPRFGKVAISVNLRGQNRLSDAVKSEYVRYLSTRSPLAIEPIFIDPEFLYAETIIEITYSRNLTNKSQDQLETIVREATADFSSANLDDFGETLRVSRLTSIIDDLDDSIQGTTVCVNPIIEYQPVVNLALNPKFRFDAQLVKPYPFRESNGFSDFKPAITSTTFAFRGVSSRLQDDGAGNMRVISADSVNTEILNPSIGTVDYTAGEVRLVNFVVESYAGDAIKIYALTRSSDITAPNNRILTIRDEDVVVRFVETK
jgi:hypothetical protein